MKELNKLYDMGKSLYESQAANRLERERVDRINAAEHLEDCDKSLDVTTVNQRTFSYYVPGNGAFDPGFGGQMDSFRDIQCQSCNAHTIAYRESENQTETRVPAAFSIKENVKGDLFITAYRGDKLVGVSTSVYGSPTEVLSNQSLPNDQGVYLAAGAVAKESQGEGIYQAMVLQRIYAGLDKGVNLVYTRTQNPRVEQSIISAMRILKLSKDIKDCTLERVKLPGFYGAMLTGEKPATNDKKLQKVYAELNMRAGDAYVLLFRLIKGEK